MKLGELKPSNGATIFVLLNSKFTFLMNFLINGKHNKLDFIVTNELFCVSVHTNELCVWVSLKTTATTSHVEDNGNDKSCYFYI